MREKLLKQEELQEQGPQKPHRGGIELEVWDAASTVTKGGDGGWWFSRWHLFFPLKYVVPSPVEIEVESVGDSKRREVMC